jgi:hypothetical protein
MISTVFDSCQLGAIILQKEELDFQLLGSFRDTHKQGSAVASVAVSGDKILVKRLPNNASIFSAKSSAILLALDMISQTSNLKFLILSDSLS